MLIKHGICVFHYYLVKLRFANYDHCVHGSIILEWMSKKVWEGMGRIHLAHLGTRAGPSEHSNSTSCCMKGAEFDHLSDY
jgi:trehalose utilization protein